MKIDSITLCINGTEYQLSIGTMFGQLPPSETLSETLRNRLGLTGSKQRVVRARVVVYSNHG